MTHYKVTCHVQYTLDDVAVAVYSLHAINEDEARRNAGILLKCDYPKALAAAVIGVEPWLERCPTCGEAVASMFDHVDRFTCPATGACLEVNDDEMTNEKWEEACAEGTWPKYINGEPMKPALAYDYDAIFSHAAALTDANIRQRLRIPKWIWAFLSEETRAKLHELME